MTEQQVTAIAFEKDPVKREAMIDELTVDEVKELLKLTLRVVNFDEQRKARGEL